MFIRVEFTGIFSCLGAPLFSTGEQMNMHPSEIGFWRSYFMSSWKHSWYRQKKFLIPAGILVMLCIVAIVLGSVIGTKMSQTVLGNICFLVSNHIL